MNLDKISNFIKTKRKELGITQEELAEKLFITEKAVSRWETGRGTPDISLLIPLSKELNVNVSELLCGEENKKIQNETEEIIKYDEITKSTKFNFQFKLVVLFYVVSILLFLVYLKFEYNPNFELNYFLRLFTVVISSGFVIVGNKIYSDNYVEKLEDKKKIEKISRVMIFVYYVILLFNMVIFARHNSVNSYNFIPFKSIIEILKNRSLYSIIINIFGNLFVFMPLEYFIIEMFNINKLSVNFALSFMIILLIEIFQYVFSIGVFDIDDLIICTFGMMLFYIVYNKAKKVYVK